jgi:hypothetical protein
VNEDVETVTIVEVVTTPQVVEDGIYLNDVADI